MPERSARKESNNVGMPIAASTAPRSNLDSAEKRGIVRPTSYAVSALTIVASFAAVRPLTNDAMSSGTTINIDSDESS